MTRGALALMESEAELAGVLAHEVGHVNRRHVIEGIRKSDMMQSVRDESGISGTTLDRAVGQGANAIFSGYSREDESEADSLGVEYAAGAGYDPQGLPRFVSHLNRHAGKDRWRRCSRPTRRRTRASRGSGASSPAILARRRERWRSASRRTCIRPAQPSRP